MGEYAYDFTGRNAHHGHVHNPHDKRRMPGGSSSGSGAAVGGRLTPLALASDTNGSIRVPSSLCGVFGLKPTFGRLSRHGTYPFVASLDHLGPMTRSVRDLALSYDAMQGPDADDIACAQRPVEPAAPVLGRGIAGLKIAVAGGYFANNMSESCAAALSRAAAALGAASIVEFPEAQRARAAAFLITASEGAALHLERLRTRAADFDPETRDRFLAGALIPAAWVNRAQRFRHWYRRQVADLFTCVDVILAPATPIEAPLLDQMTMRIGGVEVPVRPSFGIYTQPISFIGLPVVAAPIAGPGLPVAIQVIGRPWEEATVLRVAAELERQGVAAAKEPT
jgi:aspartyl-tRNA(Asn)/glutamyl-tRNA(Gln) amidotransferase subunit A